MAMLVMVVTAPSFCRTAFAFLYDVRGHFDRDAVADVAH
jgi:hypothetical protein